MGPQLQGLGFHDEGRRTLRDGLLGEWGKLQRSGKAHHWRKTRWQLFNYDVLWMFRDVYRCDMDVYRCYMHFMWMLCACHMDAYGGRDI
jgi:hypothetical protein